MRLITTGPVCCCVINRPSLAQRASAGDMHTRTSAIDKLGGRWCASARCRDGLPSFFDAILAKMARLTVRGRCMCCFRFHETESAYMFGWCRWLWCLFVTVGWPFNVRRSELSYRAQVECCNLASWFILFLTCLCWFDASRFVDQRDYSFVLQFLVDFFVNNFIYYAIHTANVVSFHLVFFFAFIRVSWKEMQRICVYMCPSCPCRKTGVT